MTLARLKEEIAQEDSQVLEEMQQERAGEGEESSSGSSEEASGSETSSEYGVDPEYKQKTNSAAMFDFLITGVELEDQCRAVIDDIAAAHSTSTETKRAEMQSGINSWEHKLKWWKELQSVFQPLPLTVQPMR